VSAYSVSRVKDGERPAEMTKLERSVGLGTVILPAVAFVGAILLFWNHGVDAADLGVLAVMYLLTALGVTIGYHRLFTHRSFEAVRPLQYVLAVLGSMAAQGPLAHWVADHRKHHAHTDKPGDPHSPHTHDHGPGVRGVFGGLVHAHFGWLMTDWGQADHRRYARDIIEDPVLRRIHKGFVAIFLLGLALPALAGYLIQGSLLGAATGLLWGGFVRVFLLHHVTWSINSVCHYYGRRRFDVEDHSTNVFWLALPSLGEAWHHNHHAFPRSAEHGLRRWEMDPSAWVIRALERVGLVHGVVRITPERQAERTLGGTG
jgi:stearoyl-CoA desaturase (Delta-9 desaturase)